MRRHLILLALASLSLARFASAADWPAFRGPQGNGWSDEKNVPTMWGKDQNIQWKVKLPSTGNGSPIVVGNRVLVTCAQEEGKKRGLYCFDRASGNPLWEQIVDFGKVLPTHNTNPYCSPDAGERWPAGRRLARHGRPVLLRPRRQAAVEARRPGRVPPHVGLCRVAGHL